MKLIIEIDNDTYLQSYLSILSIGLLECLEKKLISYDDAMNILYFPGIIDKFEEIFPDLFSCHIDGKTFAVCIAFLFATISGEA